MAKKIGAIVSLSIIGILILATIIMANVNVNYKINCAEPTKVYVSYGSNVARDAQEYSDDIVNFINNASKEKSLTALFNGNLNKKAVVKKASSVGKSIPSTTGFYVRYRYSSSQNLMEGKSKHADNVKYEELVFTVNDIAGSSVVNVYVVEDSTQSTLYTYYYELEANFEGLYDFLVEKGFNV